jgi:hypothetical protein
MVSLDKDGKAAGRALKHVGAVTVRAPALAPDVRVTLNFHPDRLVAGRPVLARMADDGLYASQFVTGTSSGGLTAHPGGDRWRWESRLFGGAYDEAAGHERPVYGALDDRSPGIGIGAAPRFGSAHLRLSAQTLRRTTFCYPDSVLEPTAQATLDGVAALVALARQDREAGRCDALDDYVEAQVHGGVRLDRDVEALVLDPSHRGTDVEAAARRLPCPVQWHHGFRLGVDELRRYPDYRGPQFVALGAALAVRGVLTPRAIGDAARAGRHDEQALKRVWHLLARFGAPRQHGAGKMP